VAGKNLMRLPMISRIDRPHDHQEQKPASIQSSMIIVRPLAATPL
jgi:hypothetical protein